MFGEIILVTIRLWVLVCLWILILMYLERKDKEDADPPKPPNLPDRYVQVRKKVGPLRFDTVWENYEKWLAEQGLTVKDVYDENAEVHKEDNEVT